MGHTARLAECLRDPRESSSEKADKIRKCLRQVLYGQETRWRRGRNSQKAVLLYFIILLGLGFALKILNLEENGSGKLRRTSGMCICSNLKEIATFRFEHLIVTKMRSLSSIYDSTFFFFSMRVFIITWHSLTDGVSPSPKNGDLVWIVPPNVPLIVLGT